MERLVQERNDSERDLFSELKLRETELLSFRTLANMAGAFINYLSAHRDAITERGVAHELPPRYSWFSERLGNLYPDISDPYLELKVDPALRAGFLEVRLRLLRLLEKSAKDWLSPLPHKDERRNFIESLSRGSIHLVQACIHLIKGELDNHNLRAEFLCDLDHRYIRLNLFRHPPEHAALIRSGGLTDLLEVAGYFVKLGNRHGMAIVAETLEAERLLRWNKDKGAPELRYKNAYDIPPRFRPAMDQALSQFKTVKFCEKPREPMFDLSDEMTEESLMEAARLDLLDPGKETRRAPPRFWLTVNHALLGPEFPRHRLTPTVYAWIRMKEPFQWSNSLTQVGGNSNEWELEFEGGAPVRIRHLGLKCIAYLFKNPHRKIHVSDLDQIMGAPCQRTSSKESAERLHARRRQQMRVRNSIFSKKDGVISALEKEHPSFADHLRNFIPMPEKDFYQYTGDKFSFRNVKVSK